MSCGEACACRGADPRDVGGGKVECIECGLLVRRDQAADATFGFTADCEVAARLWEDGDDPDADEDAEAADAAQP